jgi:polysaccharide export outer membrane protein
MAAVAFSACSTSQESAKFGGSAANPDPEGRLRAGDLLIITFQDVVTPIPPFEGRIKEDGKVTLTQNQDFMAAGKTVADLEREIHDRYVPKYFANMTPTVKAENRFFYVDGQVRAPSRQPYWGPVTVLGAIASSGGFTEFAQPKKVKIIRANGKIQIVNCVKAKEHPELDLSVYPNDHVDVPRKFW